MSRQTSVGEAPARVVYETFGLPKSTFYAALDRRRPENTTPTAKQPEAATSNQVKTLRTTVPTDILVAAIKAVIDEYPAWGVRKVWATLRRQGLRVSRRRVWKVMKARGWTLPAVCANRKEQPRGHVAVPYPNRLLATDLTTVQTAQDGTVAVVITVDCGCRSVLDVTATKSQEAPDVLASLDRGLVAAFGCPDRVPDGVDIRSDHGPQYTGGDAEALCEAWGVTHTFSPVGRPTGNAVAERTIQTMKVECIWVEDFDSIEELDAALQAWKHNFNHNRPHQALDYATPAEYRATALGLLSEAA